MEEEVEMGLAFDSLSAALDIDNRIVGKTNDGKFVKSCAKVAKGLREEADNCGRLTFHMLGAILEQQYDPPPVDIEGVKNGAQMIASQLESVAETADMEELKLLRDLCLCINTHVSARDHEDWREQNRRRYEY
jgi:hypothetical protein